MSSFDHVISMWPAAAEHVVEFVKRRHDYVKEFEDACASDEKVCTLFVH